MQIISSRCIIRTFHSHEIDSFMVYRNDAEWMKYQGFKGLTKRTMKQSCWEFLHLFAVFNWPLSTS